MGLNDTVSAERLHIGFFGVRNAGKSSVVNAVTGQELSVVSDVLGTTTDPVKKAMELLPLGPVVIIDTPGIDDEGVLGEMRVQKARQMLDSTDIAVLVADATKGLTEWDKKLIQAFQEKNTPYLIAYNKSDLLAEIPSAQENEIYISALTKLNIYELKEHIGKLKGGIVKEKPIVSDLLKGGELAVLVVPIDSAAPKGRLILPQQQTLRDLLDAGNMALVCTDKELPSALKSLFVPPKIVITDSQAFGSVSKVVPPEMLLTSFSILMARYKGNLPALVAGAAMLDKLKDGDTVLIAEGCTHHRQCDDIGTVKIPKWLSGYTQTKINLEFVSGTEFPQDLKKYALVIHCGGCTLNEKEMTSRVARAHEQGIPMTNYGSAIAQRHGILRRSLSPFPKMAELLKNSESSE